MCKAYIIFLIKTIVDYRVTVNLARLFLWSSLVAQRSSWQPCQSNYPRRRGVNFWKRLKMLNTRKTLTTRMSMTIKLFKFNHCQLVDDVSVWVNYSWEYWTMKLLNLKKKLWIMSVLGMKKKNYQRIENRRLANPPSCSYHSNHGEMFHFYFYFK